MSRANSSRAAGFSGKLSLACGFAFSLVVATPSLGADKAQDILTWRTDEESGELDDSFEERVRELQGWLRQREAERSQSWGNDVVTPENRALTPPPRSFGAEQYDAQGYRRLNENTRFRLRTQEPSWGLERSWGDEAASQDGSEAEPKQGGDRRSKHKRRIRRR